MNKKLNISVKKYRGASKIVSARLPEALIRRVDELAKETGRTRNELIQTFIEFSIENIQIEQ